MLKETKLFYYIEEYNKVIKNEYELIKQNITNFKIKFFEFKKMYLLVKSRGYRI